MADGFANKVLNLGLRNDDKVCLVLDNCLDHLYCWLGFWENRCFGCRNEYRHKGQILLCLINNSGAKALVV